MVNGVDTTFMVQCEILEHEGHAAARELLRVMFEEGDYLALTPQVLTEFIHVVTDPRRFERPLSMEQAVAKAQLWWNAPEVRKIYPTGETLPLFNRWMLSHKLGRKRILDTMLAATCVSNGIMGILSTNARDFSLFPGIDVRRPD